MNDNLITNELINVNFLTNKYYGNDAYLIRKMVDKILSKFGGIVQKDYDDFYSVANETFTTALRDYDGTIAFPVFLKSCLIKKIKGEITRRNRLKRTIDRDAVSLNEPIKDADDSDITLEETIPSKLFVDEEIVDKKDSIENYLKSLSYTQREIVKMLYVGYEPIEIRTLLKLSKKQYDILVNDLSKIEKTSLLNKNKTTITKECVPMPITEVKSNEKSKPISYSIFSLAKKMDDYGIRFDYKGQRNAGQWGSKMKGNLISDILQDNPLPPLVFAEQIIDGMPIIWDIDGKQRCTTVHGFKHDKFKVSRLVKRPIISYRAIKRDKKGTPILSSNGVPEFEWKEFDITNKRFSQLPEELQDKFNDYCFNATLYLNCTDEDILYHIARYNEGKPMNSSQKSVISLGGEFIPLVKSISNMPFFIENHFYSDNELRNGTINRIVVESVMATHYLSDWKKSPEDMCSYIKEHAVTEDFSNIEDSIERLDSIVDENISWAFTAKDSFIWITMFSRFKDAISDDNTFLNFINDFKESLHAKKINGISYDEINEDRSTKGKALIMKKINLLTELMENYYDVELFSDCGGDGEQLVS